MIVSGPRQVKDAFLRNGRFWGKWNFGKAPYLEVGTQPSTVYDIYRAVSLIRFDLSGSTYGQVTSAKLRLYVPRNQTQMVPVPISVHAIAAANAGWIEGSAESEPQADACSWSARAAGHPWAGAPGLTQAGVDYVATPLDTKTAEGMESGWLEFNLPKELVQSWLDHPEANAGLLLRTDDSAEPGQHTHICSSQHWTGQGPQLVIEGHFSPDKIVAATGQPEVVNAPYRLPPMGPLYEKWLANSKSRYAVWVRDPKIGLQGEQRVFPYIWDIMVRGEIILPKSTLPLSDITTEIPAVVARGDRKRAREIVDEFMQRLMIYDYARDRIWYDSGPSDVVSPLQVARFFASENSDESGEAHGIYSGYGFGKAMPDLESVIASQLAEIKRRLNPTPEQFAVIEREVRRDVPLEYSHRAEVTKSLARVRELIASQTDGVEMLRALRSMFFHHRMYLIYQSLFSMPKYQVLVENGDILGYAQWFYQVRRGQYNKARMGRQLADVNQYFWKPD